jgi:hypothetical protein
MAFPKKKHPQNGVLESETRPTFAFSDGLHRVEGFLVGRYLTTPKRVTRQIEGGVFVGSCDLAKPPGKPRLRRSFALPAPGLPALVSEFFAENERSRILQLLQLLNSGY